MKTATACVGCLAASRGNMSLEKLGGVVASGSPLITTPSTLIKLNELVIAQRAPDQEPVSHSDCFSTPALRWDTASMDR